MGSPAQHKTKTRQFLSASKRASTLARRLATDDKCLDSLMRLLEARMNLGSATAESHWWDYNPDRLADGFRQHTDATLEFERSCLRAK